MLVLVVHCVDLECWSSFLDRDFSQKQGIRKEISISLPGQIEM